MSRPYYMLFVEYRAWPAWQYEFGDYDLETVRAEADDSKMADDVRAVKIIKAASDDQDEIDGWIDRMSA